MGKTSKTGYPQKENPGYLKALLTLLTSGILVACAGAPNNPPDPVSNCPGLSARSPQVTVCATVPEHEPASIGTVQITLQSTLNNAIHEQKKQQHLILDRDGTPQNLWLLSGSSGDPVVVLLTRSAGSGSYPELQGLEKVNGEYRPFELAPLSGQQQQGYMGHDLFQVKNGQLYRHFPIYRPTDTNSNPSGGQACFRYDINQSEWNLCPD